MATSRALKETLLAFKMVTRRAVAVMRWDEPPVREVYRYKVESAEYDLGVVSAISAQQEVLSSVTRAVQIGACLGSAIVYTHGHFRLIQTSGTQSKCYEVKFRCMN